MCHIGLNYKYIFHVQSFISRRFFTNPNPNPNPILDLYALLLINQSINPKSILGVIVHNMLSPAVLEGLRTDLIPTAESFEPGRRSEDAAVLEFCGLKTKVYLLFTYVHGMTILHYTL